MMNTYKVTSKPKSKFSFILLFIIKNPFDLILKKGGCDIRIGQNNNVLPKLNGSS